jgi:hypothetical protein
VGFRRATVGLDGAAVVLRGGAVLVLLALGLGACARTPSPTGGAGSPLELTFRMAPRDAAAPVFGPVDTIRVFIQGVDAQEIVLPIARGQNRFQASAEVFATGAISVAAAAIGGRPIAGSPTQTQTGRGALFVADARNIPLEPGRFASVELEFTPFVAEFHEPTIENDGATHRVRWTDLEGATYWRLYRREGGFVLPDTIVHDTTYTGRRLPAEYQVRAFGSGHRPGAPSDILTILGGPPSIPTGLLAVAGSDEVVLTWDPPNAPVESFDIQRAVEGDAFEAWGTRDGDVVEAIDTGVLDGLEYAYRIRARRGDQVSPFSAASSAVVPLRAPLDLQAESGRAVITLLWTDASASESGFEVQRRTGSTSPFQPLATLPPNSKEFTDQQPPAGVPLEYRVRAVRGARVSEWAGPVGVTP